SPSASHSSASWAPTSRAARVTMRSYRSDQASTPNGRHAPSWEELPAGTLSRAPASLPPFAGAAAGGVGATDLGVDLGHLRVAEDLGPEGGRQGMRPQPHLGDPLQVEGAVIGHLDGGTVGDRAVVGQQHARAALD